MKLKNILSLFLFSIVLGLSFTACNNDDDNNNPEMDIHDKLNGTTWKLTKTEANVEASDTAIQRQVSEYILKMNVDGGITYAFKNGTARKKSGNDIIDLAKYSLSEDKILFEKPDTTGINLTLQDSVIVGLSDVKNYVAKQLDIDTAKITKAEKKDSFIKDLKSIS